MIRTGINLGNGYRLTSSGKLERVKGYGAKSVSAKIAQRKSKKQRVVRRGA